MVRLTQIERLWALKKIITQDWARPDGTVDAGAVLSNVGELVNILLDEPSLSEKTMAWMKGGLPPATAVGPDGQPWFTPKDVAMLRIRASDCAEVADGIQFTHLADRIESLLPRIHVSDSRGGP